MLLVLSICTFAALWNGLNGAYLQVNGTHLTYGGQKVFLNGVNQAWVSYGFDFGNNNYAQRGAELERYLKEIHDNGGNSVRIWLHIEGESTPNIGVDGRVIGPDAGGHLINDMKKYLEKALEYNILVFFTLWNGAQAKHDQHWKINGFIMDLSKLDTYINKALIPMVLALKHEPALGGWDIMNEPEGVVIPGQHNHNHCYDTQHLSSAGAGWAGHYYSIQQLQRFINWQADAIHRTDPKALVTVGSWKYSSSSDSFGQHDMYKDSCLLKAGGRILGKIDFYQIHTYDNNHEYDANSPFKHSAQQYGLSKPIVIGEFNQVRGGGMDITAQFHHAYNQGYAGAWSWHAHADGTDTDTWDNQKRGLHTLQNEYGSGGLVKFTVH